MRKTLAHLTAASQRAPSLQRDEHFSHCEKHNENAKFLDSRFVSWLRVEPDSCRGTLHAALKKVQVERRCRTDLNNRPEQPRAPLKVTPL
jgi:hypothetical protein